MARRAAWPGHAISSSDSPKTIAHHTTTTEHRALARVPTRGFHAFAKSRLGRRHDARETASRSRDS